ncbi:hypothetical protein BH24ACT15_BH24ACT15_32640 [soil metagenome]
MNMVRATTVSSNVYFAAMVDQFTGPEGLAETATRMGIVNTDLFAPGDAEAPVCATVLGASEVYPLDMASGFGTMANSGSNCAPYAITSIQNAAGDVIYEGGDDCIQSISPDHAATATSLLRGPIENGTASRNGQIGRPAAGKTGTTQDWKDAWFVGFIPQMSTAVWVGNEIPTTMTDPRCGNVTGGCLPTMIWADFMTSAIEYRNLDVADFPPPPRLPSDRVPSVVGMTEGQAEAALAEAEFSSESVSVSDYRPAGTVVSQSPAGGSQAPKGTLVVLDVSDGTGAAPEVPDVIGLGVDEARQVILNAGLDPIVVEVLVEDPEQYGIVVGASIDPESGQVTIQVGRERNADDPPVSEEPSEEPTSEGTPEPVASPEPTTAPTSPPEATPTQAPTAAPPPESGGGGGGGGGSDPPAAPPSEVSPPPDPVEAPTPVDG